MTGQQAIVAGSGPAGLSAACLLAEAGIGVTVVAPPPDLNDPRTVALMRPSIDLLRNLGLWPGTLEGACAPLRRLRIVDDTGGVVTAPELSFLASEIGEEAFGWNVPLALLVPALHQRAMDFGARMLDTRVTGLRVGTEDSDDTDQRWRTDGAGYPCGGWPELRDT